MKTIKTYSLLILVLFAAILTSCKEDALDDVPEITEISFPESGSSLNLLHDSFTTYEPGETYDFMAEVPDQNRLIIMLTSEIDSTISGPYYFYFGMGGWINRQTPVDEVYSIYGCHSYSNKPQGKITIRTSKDITIEYYYNDLDNKLESLTRTIQAIN